MQQSPEDRVVALESVVAHLERQLDQLNEVILEQQALIERLRLRIEQVERFQTELPQAKPDPYEERPPHY